jgi:hypothetical protein
MMKKMILTAVAALTLAIGYSGCGNNVQALQAKMKDDLTLYVTMPMLFPDEYKEEDPEALVAYYSTEYQRISYWISKYRPFVMVRATEEGWSVKIEPPVGLQFRDAELTSRGLLGLLHSEIPELKCCEIVTSLGVGANLVVRYAVKEGFSVREERW